MGAQETSGRFPTLSESLLPSTVFSEAPSLSAYLLLIMRPDNITAKHIALPMLAIVNAKIVMDKFAGTQTTTLIGFDVMFWSAILSATVSAVIGRARRVRHTQMAALLLFCSSTCLRAAFPTSYVPLIAAPHDVLTPLAARCAAAVGETAFAGLIAFRVRNGAWSCVVLGLNAVAQACATVGVIKCGDPYLFVVEGVCWGVILVVMLKSCLQIVSWKITVPVCCYGQFVVYAPLILNQLDRGHRSCSTEITLAWSAWRHELAWQMTYFLLGPLIAAAAVCSPSV